MRFAFLLRHRRRLLMQLDPTHTSSIASQLDGRPNLKRSLAQQATANAKVQRVAGLDSPSHLRDLSAHSTHPPAVEMPPKQNKSSLASKGALSLRSGPSGSSSRSRGRGGKHTEKRMLDLPLHDAAYIRETYGQGPPLKPLHLSEPKSALGNFAIVACGTPAKYDTTSGHISVDGSDIAIFRTTVAIEINGVTYVGVGDHPEKKGSEHLAALSAVYQLQSSNLLEKPKKVIGVVKGSNTDAKLSDGSHATYEQARSFMDYYCRRFKFGYPDVAFSEIRHKGTQSWEAIMTVGGRRIGMGTGSSKKDSQINCYLDVTQYLESCDPELWQTYLKAAKTGADLGLAPKVFFQMGDGLDDEIRDLCHDIKKSDLYRNRPASAPAKSEPSAADANAATRAFTRQMSPEFFEQKSQTLLKQRQQYLVEPRLELMRQQRSSLPVYTRAEDVLSHIQDHDVTICMAATGSGKTTQIPQLILDQWIDKGKGAECNIVCTQPRRLAAISVADRIAKERGQTLGQQIGYQVRFENNLPEEHGSITFCTTGVFLRRLQTSLSSTQYSGTRSLDDITHILVDEVHERDVDTDLLLVVLKRLLADRKARNKPVKIVLMSATIDPTLFQKYFPDDDGKPAGVTEIPGRSYPVTKYFMDDYVPQLVTPATRWVFDAEPVAKYLARELEPAALQTLRINAPRTDPNKDQTDELELPYPLIALTIAHVLQRTDSGHVLVFLPGWEEIQATQRMLLNPLGSLGIKIGDNSRFSLHLLHSSIPLAEQQVIFEPPPAGIRRIILATNIAETSITIPDVVYVVDTAKIKEQRYDPDRHMSSLVSAWVGASNINQRAGRAGRHRSGEYFGILGQRHADALHPHQTVEMKRVDLSNVVMHVKALNFPGMAVEEVLAATIEPPAETRVAAAMNDLRMVGAIDSEKNLTSLGRVLLQLPVEAQMGRLVLFGSFFRCLDQALTLAAILTNRDPFLAPMHLKAEAAKVKLSWTPTEFRSDALATLRAYNAWWTMQSRGQYVAANRFCSDNFLAKSTLLMIQRIKGHLLQSLYHAGVIDVSAGGTVESYSRSQTVPPELNTNGESLPLLAALIAIASQPNFAIRTGDYSYRTSQDKATFIHPSSVNHRKRETKDENDAGEKQLFAFAEKRQNISTGNTAANTFLVTTTRLDPLTYMLFGAYNLEVVERGLECDGWLPIVGNLDALDDIQRLKTLMDACMLRVFEGITLGRRQKNRKYIPIQRREEEAESESESGDDEYTKRDYSLSMSEVKDLDLMTRDIVRILNRYSDERKEAQSRQSSRPATPMGGFGSSLFGSSGFGSSSPGLSPMKLPGGSSYNSRSNTPSRLSRRF